MAKKKQKVPVRTGASSKKIVKPKTTPKKNDKGTKRVSSAKGKGFTDRPVNSNHPKAGVGKKNNSLETGVGKKNNSLESRPERYKAKARHVKAAPIEYSKEGLKQLRRTVRKSDGTFFKKSYYQKLLKKVQGKNRDEVDDELIRLRNANPKVRYYVESTAQTLHYQTGNFVDRLAGKIETVGIRKGKRKSAVKLTGKIKRGTSVTITDLKGDEHDPKSVAQATDLLRRQNAAINRVIDRVRETAIRAATDEKTREKLRKKQKGTGVYVTVPEVVTSNSEGEVVSIKYDFSNITVQGIERARFDILLDEEIENDPEL